MFKKHALKTGVMAAALMGITFVACNNDDDPEPSFRSKTYTLKGLQGDKDNVIGNLVIEEVSRDSAFTMKLELKKNSKDTVHKVYLISGSTTAQGTDSLVKAFDAKGTGSAKTYELMAGIKERTVNGQKKKFNYDSVLAYSGFIKVRYSAFKDSTVILSNVLKSAQ